MQLKRRTSRADGYTNSVSSLECRNPIVCRSSNAFSSLEPIFVMGIADSGVCATARFVPEPAQDGTANKDEHTIKESAVTAAEIPGNSDGNRGAKAGTE